MQKKIVCPLCKRTINICDGQYVSGQPDGSRYVGFHDWKLTKSIKVECPMSGKPLRP